MAPVFNVSCGSVNEEGCVKPGDWFRCTPSACSIIYVPTEGLEGHISRYKYINRPQEETRLQYTIRNKGVPSRPYSTLELSEFKAFCSQTTDPATYSLASEIQFNVPIYDLANLESTGLTANLLTRLQDEWHHILHQGPGVYVLRSMCACPKYTSLTSTNHAFDAIIAREHAHGQEGDHFALSGTNDRIQERLFQTRPTRPILRSPLCQPMASSRLRVLAGSRPPHNRTSQRRAPRRRSYHGSHEEDACKRYPAATKLASQFLTP